MIESLRHRWPEYLAEALGLGLFMLSAAAFGTLLEAPGSPLRDAVTAPYVRRILMGAAMGVTAVLIVHSPLGKRSGAHLNPAVTLTFLRLGKTRAPDAAWYVVAQFVGGAAGVLLASGILGRAFTEAPVDRVRTVPGASGIAPAFAAEAAISFVLMLVVLTVASSRRHARWAGICAGTLVALYIALEAPVSGMSMNPARSFASALPGFRFDSLWIYFSAPVAGMLLAGELHRRLRSGAAARHCAKLLHAADYRCIHCGHVPARGTP